MNPNLKFWVININEEVRRERECLKLCVKHSSDSGMVWDCTLASGIGDLVKINGILITDKILI